MGTKRAKGEARGHEQWCTSVRTVTYFTYARGTKYVSARVGLHARQDKLEFLERVRKEYQY